MEATQRSEITAKPFFGEKILTETTPTRRAIECAIKVLGIGGIFFFFYLIYFPAFDPIFTQNLFLLYACGMLFLSSLLKTQQKKMAFLVGLASVVLAFCAVYVSANYEELDMYVGMPLFKDQIVGWVMVICVLTLTSILWGSIFVVLTVLAILYALFGHLIPGVFGHQYMNPRLVISNLSVGFDGIYGVMLSSSYTMLMPFFIFGSLFSAFNIHSLFNEIGNFLGNHTKGGSAYGSIASSSLVGMVTGSATANVAFTGAFTIPLMSRSGFKPTQAAAIEAMASSGGNITPPVLGVVVFIMAGFLGVPYGDLMINSIVPCVLFYLITFQGVRFMIGRENIQKIAIPYNTNIIKVLWPLFVFPIGLVVYLLIARYSPGYAAGYAILTLVGIGFARRKTWPTFAALVRSLSEGSGMVVKFAVVAGCMGMFSTMVTSSGAGPKLSALIQLISFGSTPVLLFLTMILCILLGCALPTLIAYLIVAVTIAPELYQLGIPLTVAHFFVFYSAHLASVTPPIAGAVIIGAQIANANYWAASLESFKLALPFFVVPIFLVYHPILLLMPGPLVPGLITLFSITIGITAMNAAAQRYIFRKLNTWECYVFVIVALLTMVDSLTIGHNYYLIAALLVFIPLVLEIWFSSRKKNMLTPSTL